MNWKERLKGKGVDDDLIESLEEEFNSMIENRLKKDREKRGTEAGVTGDKIKELEGRIADYEKLIKMDAADKEQYSSKIKLLQSEIESARDDEKKKSSKMFDETKTELEIYKKKFETMKSETKRNYISSILNKVVTDMKLDKPKVAVDWLMYKGFLDAEEKFNADGTFAGFIPKSKPITYLDKETKVEIKDKVFSGEEKIGDFFKMAYETDKDFQSNFSVIEDVSRGSGTTGKGGNSSGNFSGSDDQAISQLLKKG